MNLKEKREEADIPKMIHYCWFGRGEKPQSVVKCINSWRKHCPGYEIVEWNEDKIDIDSNAYAKEAYQCRKWAFVTDYVRLRVLCEQGGIYMDTDVELLKPMDELLRQRAFMGFEDECHISTALMAGVRKHPLFEQFLTAYKDRHFLKPDGKMDFTTNVEVLGEICFGEGLLPNGKKQKVLETTFYPQDFFSPKIILPKNCV